VDGITLEFEDVGSGEPVVCIHGAFIADAFRSLLSQGSLAVRYRLITYHRRGYAGSSRATAPTTVREQAGDLRSLLSQLGVRRAHVIGHSFGALVALQLALETPKLVQTLALLEAGLMIGESAQSYRQALIDAAQRYRQVGAEVAVDEFLQMRWPGYQDKLEGVLPGAFKQAVADAPAFFDSDLAGGLEWQFGEAEARRVTQPALVVLGERSAALHPRFAETHRLLLDWMPHAEGFLLPEAAHLLQLEQPAALARALAEFFGRHPLAE
jgi:pimeloyl-ACP methyl ester carboxylesterase